MKKLTKPGQWGTAVLGGPTDTTTRVLLTWIWANGGEAFNADMTAATFAANPKTLEAIKTYLGLVQQGLAAPSPNTTNLTSRCCSGRARSPPCAAPTGRSPRWWWTTRRWPARWWSARCPATAHARHAGPRLDLGLVQIPDQAWKFIKFQAEKKWALERARVSNWMPLRNDMLNEPEVARDPLMQRFLEVGAKARSYPLPHPAWADIGTVDIVKAVQRALLDPAQTDQIFRDLDALLNKKLNDL